MADGDRFLICGKFGDVFARVVIERELALLRQQQDAGRRKLLRSRTDVVDQFWAVWDIVFQIGHPVTARVNQFAIFDHAQGAAGRIRFVELREDCVNPGLQAVFVFAAFLSRGGDRDEERGDYQIYEFARCPHCGLLHLSRVESDLRRKSIGARGKYHKGGRNAKAGAPQDRLACYGDQSLTTAITSLPTALRTSFIGFTFVYCEIGWNFSGGSAIFTRLTSLPSRKSTIAC